MRKHQVQIDGRLIGVLSDAHGNPVGLRRCLDALHESSVDALFFLGDAVGYLPMAEETLRILEAYGCWSLMGNHEAMLLEMLDCDAERDSAYGLGRLRGDDALRRRVREWPLAIELQCSGRRALLVHGSPWDPLTGYVYPDTDLKPFGALPFDAVIMGHTHRPFVQKAGAVTVVNVGSCGLPRDVGNLASCALVDMAALSVKTIRVEFDVSEVAARARALGHYPSQVAACLERRGMDHEGEAGHD